jgi:DNA polymerase-3 subunit beta
MKLSLSRTSFLKALSHGQSVVEKRTTVPILSHVLLQADDQGLRLTTTDMDLALIETIEAEVHQGGETTVSAHMLFDIVKKLPDTAPIQLTYDKNSQKLSIQSHRSSFELSCLPAEDYPKLSQTHLPMTFDLPSATLKRLIDKTKFCTTQEDTRYYLSGLYFHIPEDSPKHLRMVATDGHRLASLQCELPEGAENLEGVIISRKTYTEITRLLAEQDTIITIGLSQSRIELTIGRAVLTSRLVEGNYPSYEQAIPSNNTKKLIVPRRAFADAVDRVGTVAQGDKIRVVKIQLESNQMTLSALSHDVGQACETLSVEYEDTPFTVGFNARYVLEMCQHIDDDEICIYLDKPSQPSIVKTLNNEDMFYILMPLRVN